MGSLSTAEQRKLAYFHALGKVMTENTQAVYESKYKSSHNVRLNEIWSDDIQYSLSVNDAINQSLSNSAVTYYQEVELDMVYGSNYQSYSFILNGTFKDNTYPIAERGQVTSGGTYIRPWISPVDIPHPITNEPSNGFELRLYRGDDATTGTPGSQIYLTEGAWSVDYYSGIIHFAENYTPNVLGWGSIKASFFQYTGDFGLSGDTISKNAYTSVLYNSGTTELIFNSGSTNETIIDLSSLDNKDAFTTAIYVTNNSTIVFNSGSTNETTIDLTDLKTVTGVTSLLSNSNTNMVANNTSSGSTLACNIGIISGNISNSMVSVFVNGVQVNVGNNATDDCYFSSDGGTTPKQSGTESAGDLLYWNYNGFNPVIGYELTTNDRITFLHLTI